jgi:hypothetical protein
MDRKYIDDHHIAARYLADQLSDSEREAFEAYYVEHPEMMQELEAAARVKVGLMGLRRAGQLEPLLQAPARIGQARRFAAAAAVVAVAIGVTVFFMRGPSTATMLAASPAAFVDGNGAPVPIARTLTLMNARGAGPDAEMTMAESAGTIELRIRTEFDAVPPVYQVAFSSIGADGRTTTLARIDGLAATEDGYVRVYLGGPRKAGSYEVMLSGDAGTSAAGQATAFVLEIR